MLRFAIEKYLEI